MNDQPIHPLHILDDLLNSLPMGELSAASVDEIQDENQQSVARSAAMAMAEEKRDLVLRAADGLFGTNMSLLENALALLDEHEQSQRNNCEEIDSDNTHYPTVPVIRKVRAKRSGREAILIRKQRKRPSNKSNAAVIGSSCQLTVNDKVEGRQHIMNDYYLCLLGRDRTDRRAQLTSTAGCSRIYRHGAHCTCRSFFQNIKGVSRSSSTSKPSCSNGGVCKHLLATILMPHLLPWSRTGVVSEIVDDRKFAKLIMGASVG